MTKFQWKINKWIFRWKKRLSWNVDWAWYDHTFHTVSCTNIENPWIFTKIHIFQPNNIFYHNRSRSIHFLCQNIGEKRWFFRKFHKFYGALTKINVVQNATSKKKNIQYGGANDNRMVSTKSASNELSSTQMSNVTNANTFVVCSLQSKYIYLEYNSNIWLI